MKIFSKHHDYYDSVLAYGVDDTVKWVRDVKEIARYKPLSSYYRDSVNLEGLTEEERLFESEMMHDCPLVPRLLVQRKYTEPMGSMRWRFVGVAGKMYPVLIVGVDNKNYGTDYTYCYGVDDIMALLETFEADGNKGVIDDFKKTTKGMKYKPWRGWKKNATASAYDRYRFFFEKWHGTDKFQPLFIKHGVPIITCRKDGNDWIMETNSNLSDVGFQKVMDPFATYQEIEMFLSGVLGGESPPMAQIQDDVLMAEKKGFDKVTSFRKAATKTR